MKKLPTRAKRTMKRLAILLVLLAVVNGLGLYCVTPWRSVRIMADICDVEHPEKITRFYDPTLPIHRFALHYLVDGGDALMLCTSAYHPLAGWYDRDYCAVEAWDGAAVHAGLRMHTQGGKRTTYLFGRLDNGYIDSLSIHAAATVWEKDNTTHYEVTKVFEVPKEAIFRGKNDKRYILCPVDGLVADASEYVQYRSFRILGYDYSGAVLADEEVNFQSWSTSAD